MESTKPHAGLFRVREKYPLAHEVGELRRQVKKELADEIYILGTFHAANVFFYANFISKFLKKHKLTHRTYQLVVYIYILSQTDGDEKYFHPSNIPLIFGKPTTRVYTTLRMLTSRGILFTQQVSSPSNGKRIRCYQLTDEGKKLVHSFSREYKASITAYELTHGDILWAEINRDFNLYR